MEIQSRAPDEEIRFAPKGTGSELRLAHDWYNVNKAANGRKWRVTRYTDRGLVFLTSEDGKNYWVYASHIEISFEDGEPDSRLNIDNPPRIEESSLVWRYGKSYIILAGAA